MITSLRYRVGWWIAVPIVSVLGACAPTQTPSGKISTPEVTRQVQSDAAVTQLQLETAIANIQKQIADNWATVKAMVQQNLVAASASNQRVIDGARAAEVSAVADADAGVKKDQKIARLEAADPFRTTLKWIAIALTVGGLVIGGGLTIYFASVNPARATNIGVLAGWVTLCGIILGVFDTLLPTIERIILWSLIGGAVVSAFAVGWILYQWYKTHQKAATIVASIDTAKAAGVLTITPTAAAIISGVQSQVPGTKEMVNAAQA